MPVPVNDRPRPRQHDDAYHRIQPFDAFTVAHRVISKPSVENGNVRLRNNSVQVISQVSQILVFSDVLSCLTDIVTDVVGYCITDISRIYTDIVTCVVCLSYYDIIIIIKKRSRE